jgi:hypothetical protein
VYPPGVAFLDVLSSGSSPAFPLRSQRRSPINVVPSMLSHSDSPLQWVPQGLPHRISAQGGPLHGVPCSGSPPRGPFHVTSRGSYLGRSLGDTMQGLHLRWSPQWIPPGAPHQAVNPSGTLQVFLFKKALRRSLPKGHLWGSPQWCTLQGVPFMGPSRDYRGSFPCHLQDVPYR